MTQSPQPPTDSSYSPPPNYGLPAPRQSARKTENFILNILLYIGALLLVGSAALLLTSLAHPVVRVTLLYAGTFLFYFGGLAIYRWVPKLRLASYSFVATGVALIPLSGLATYTLIWKQGTANWLIFSFFGTLMILLGTALMRERIMSYLLITFLISDVLASSKVLQLSLIWYFAGLLLLATILGLFLRFVPVTLPRKLHLGFLDSSRVFVPVTMVVVLFYSYRLTQLELLFLYALATVYCLVFIRRPLSLSLYIQARIYSALAIFFLSHWSTQHFTMEWLPALIVAGFLLLTSLAVFMLREGTLPWPISYDGLITWSVGLFAGIVAAISIASANLSASGYRDGEHAINLWWLIPTDRNVHLLVPAWGILAIFMLSLLVLGRRLPHRYFYATIASALAFSVIAVITQGAPLLCILGGAVLLASPKPAKQHHLVKLISYLLFALGFIGAVIQTLQVPTNYIYLLLAVAFSLCTLWLTRSKAISENLRENPVREQWLLWLPLCLTGTVLLLHLPYGYSDFAALSHWELAPAAAVTTFCVTVSTLAIAISSISLLARSAAPSYPQYAYAIWTVTSSIFFISEGNLLAATIFVAVHSTLAAAAWSRLRAYRASHIFSICLRAILVMYVVKVLSANADSFSWHFISLYLCALVLAALSLLLYRSTKLLAEKILGLIFASCAVLLLPVSFIAVDVLENGHVLAKVSFGIGLLALTFCWLLMVPGIATRVFFSLVFPFTMAELLALAVYESGLSLATSSNIMLWIPLVCLLICKVLSATLPEEAEPRAPRVADSLENWGHSRLSTLVYPGLIFYTIRLLYENWFVNDFSAALLIFIVFGLYAVQAQPRYRATVLAVGLIAATLRLVFSFDDFPVFFILLEAAVSICMAHSFTNRDSTGKKVSAGAASLWWAFGIQVLTTFILSLGYHYSMVSLRVILVLVTILLAATAAVRREKAGTISVASLATVQVVWMSGGMSPLVLFVFGIAIIASVVWRLLSRQDDEPAASPASTASPVAPQETGVNSSATEESETNVPHSPGPDMPASTPEKSAAQEQKPAQENKGRNPWDPPEGVELMPWK